MLDRAFAVVVVVWFAACFSLDLLNEFFLASSAIQARRFVAFLSTQSAVLDRASRSAAKAKRAGSRIGTGDAGL